MSGRAEHQPADEMRVAAREHLRHKAAQGVTDDDDLLQTHRFDDRSEVVGAFRSVEASRPHAVAVPAEVRGDDAVPGRELGYRERPVQVRAGEKAVHEQNHGGAGGAGGFADECLPASRQANEASFGHLIGEVKVPQIESLQTGALGCR